MSLHSSYPFLIRAYNRFFSNTTIDAQKLILAAQKSVGLTDFGASDYQDRLQKLCHAINTEAQLHPFGAFANKERLKGVLKNRLRAIQLFKEQPEILDTQLNPPIIIAGLQRTGTTFLQRLLAADSDNRALLSWEALNPIPLKGKNEEKKRIQQALTSQKALHYMSPIFFSIHPVEFDSPEEEILLNDMTLLSAIPEATLNVPSFSQWVAHQDHGIAYDWMIKMLKVLEWQKAPKTWILKTPQHLEYMDVVAKKFPNAVIIHTHRHPKECIPSFCSMVYHSRKIFSKAVDPIAVAQHWVSKNIGMLKHTMAIRKKHPNLKIIDLYYADLINNPIACIQTIYQQIGRPWNDRIKAELQKAMLRNKKNKYGKHQYKMADFGLTHHSIEQDFSFYLNAHPQLITN
ncbi:sulfotransferase [Aureispira sp. CCB-E]|uniref:sulfotransferase family protein n=1 Tax=Aureispira sp. CCB-E TaxID=3051121 RepID=UPI002868CB67|nr:sulfotransferase [Aureispira sp. CCB-E]WMX15844.1 sulfotransferase [Aureispira sp. CCB-E]